MRTAVKSSQTRSAAALAAGTASAIAVLVLRKQALRWGASDDEVNLTLPGDQILDRADMVATRAITVAVSPAEVWPWIAQLGQGRGGFYSYDVLENLLGCDIHSVDNVVPAWQHIEVGDEINLAPTVPLTVALLNPGRAIVLRGGAPLGPMSAPYDFTWAFVLLDQPTGGTRLLVRERYQYRSWWAALLVEPVELASLVMSQRMLHGIKRRAERVGSSAPRLLPLMVNGTNPELSRSEKPDQLDGLLT